MKLTCKAAGGGGLGAAGAFAALMTATPSVADTGCVPDIACDVLDEARALPNSIAEQPRNFLVGDGLPADESEHTGLVNQPARFAENLAGQPDRFIESANPVNQVNRFLNGTCDLDAPAGDDAECDLDNGDHVGLLNQPRQFAENLAGQPGRFADSIERSIGAFGADVGPDGDDGAGGTG